MSYVYTNIVGLIINRKLAGKMNLESIYTILKIAASIGLIFIIIKMVVRIIYLFDKGKKKRARRYFFPVIMVIVLFILFNYWAFFTFHGNTKKDLRISPVETEGSFIFDQGVPDEPTKRELDSLARENRNYYLKRVDDPSSKKERQEADSIIDAILERQNKTNTKNQKNEKVY